MGRKREAGWSFFFAGGGLALAGGEAYLGFVMMDFPWYLATQRYVLGALFLLLAAKSVARGVRRCREPAFVARYLALGVLVPVLGAAAVGFALRLYS